MKCARSVCVICNCVAACLCVCVCCLAETKARSDADVAITKATAEEKIASTQGQQIAEKQIRGAGIDAEQHRIKADQEAHSTTLASQAALAAAKNKADALVATAQAEAKGADDLREKRRFELEMERLRVLNCVAQKGRKFISGERGAQLLQVWTFCVCVFMC